MSDLFGNHIVGFPTRRLKSWLSKLRNSEPSDSELWCCRPETEVRVLKLMYMYNLKRKNPGNTLDNKRPDTNLEKEILV